MAIFNRVVEDYILKGENNATRIAKSLGIPRKDVVVYQEEWKAIAQNDEGIKARASELLTEMDRSYDQIIKELWNTVEEADDAKGKTATLKTIADVVAKRQETLQKAGLYDDAALGDHMALVEEQAEQIKDLLMSVANNYPQYPEVRAEIINGITKIFGKPTSSEGGMHPAP